MKTSYDMAISDWSSVVCSSDRVTKAAADTLRLADHIFIEELRKSGWYDKTSQAFAVFLPVKSVGVTGDGRRYEPVIALRAVETIDFMTAHWAHLPYELLDIASRRIVNEIHGVSRVVYDISGKPPATIEWERSEEHTSELQSLMRISYAVFCLKKKKTKPTK